jgi:TctA family transporter
VVSFLEILLNILQPKIIAVMILTAFYGLFIGAMPGLTATMAAALLIPFAFWLDPLTALSMIIVMDVLAIFAGDIPSTFLRIPGTPASAAYTQEMYEMTKKGRGQIALSISIMASTLGGLLGVSVLWFFSPVLAQFAMGFSSAEFFWLAVLGLSTGVLASSGSKLKGFISLLMGLLIATIGVDPLYQVQRFTFGNPELYGGIGFIPVMIGLYGISEVLRRMYNIGKGTHVILPKVEYRLSEMIKGGLGPIKKYLMRFSMGSVIGVIIGALPGAGADIAAWLSYNISYRFSRRKTDYGKGYEEGIVAGTSANNASLGGAWIPALVFGIPGDSVTAIVLGIMMMKGIVPGPKIFTERADLVYPLMVIFFIANLLIIPFGYMAIKGLARIFLRTPDYLLVPLVLVFCIIGTYAVNYSVFDILIMLIFGVIGFFMEEYRFSLAPMVLGIILGPLTEQYFMMTALKKDPMVFISRPISIGIILTMILIWIAPIVAKKLRK